MRRAESYMIVRHYCERGKRAKVITRGLTLVAAVAHCRKPETRKPGAWFESFTQEVPS